MNFMAKNGLCLCVRAVDIFESVWFGYDVVDTV